MVIFGTELTGSFKTTEARNQIIFIRKYNCVNYDEESYQ